MKRNLFSTLSVMYCSFFLLQITACKKKPTDDTKNLMPFSYEIKDTINPTLTDSIFYFNGNGTLAAVTDKITASSMSFTYSSDQRQSNGTYEYTYDANGNLSTIALQRGQYGRDSLLLYPNGYVNIYKHATGFTQKGVVMYNIYTYTYGGAIPVNGPSGDPVAIIGKSDVFDDAGNVTFIYTDSIHISYVSTFDLGFIPLMTICNDSRVHFSNLKLWCNIPIVTKSCISRLTKSTYSNVIIPGIPPVVTTTTDDFSYEFDEQLRPIVMIRNGIPIYNIIYHD